MPNPKDFSNKQDFVGECMHQTVKIEKMDRDQGIAQCLGMWGGKGKKKKKCASELLRELSYRLSSLCTE